MSPTSSNPFDVRGKVAIVTGAASGIGREIASVMVANGVSVGLLDKEAVALETCVAELASSGGDVVAHEVDVTNRSDLRRCINAVATHFGRLDITFANAGIGAGPGFETIAHERNPAGALSAITDDLWDRVIDADLTSVFVTIQTSAEQMKTAGGGRIIVTTSIAAFRNETWVGTPYVPAKAGAAHLVRQAALELAPWGITVNAIAPGAFATNIGGGRLRDAAVRRLLEGRIPLGEVAEPSEIRGLALFLASPASRYITGVEIPIDGGASLRCG